MTDHFAAFKNSFVHYIYIINENKVKNFVVITVLMKHNNKQLIFLNALMYFYGHILVVSLFYKA